MKMKKRIRKVIVAAVILAAAYPFYLYRVSENQYETTKHFFFDLSQTIEAAGEENEIEDGRLYRQELEAWNQKTDKAMEKTFSNYRIPGNGNVNESMTVVQTLLDDVFELRNETVPLVEPLFSKRMLNPRTVKDDAEFEWRMQTLDAITAYGLAYKKRLRKVCEDFRTTIVGSELPEKYRVYIWDDWSNNLHRYIIRMGPQVEMFDGMADNYKKLFRFLHEHKNDFYFDEKGRITFEDKRHAQEYQRLFVISGVAWQS